MCLTQSVRGFAPAPTWAHRELGVAGWEGSQTDPPNLWIGLKSYVDPITESENPKPWLQPLDDEPVHIDRPAVPSRLVLTANQNAPVVPFGGRGTFALILATASVQERLLALYSPSHTWRPTYIQCKRITFAHIAPCTKPLSFDLSTGGHLYMYSTVVMPVVFNVEDIVDIGVNSLRIDEHGTPQDLRNTITVPRYWLPLDIRTAVALMFEAGLPVDGNAPWQHRAANVCSLLRACIEEQGVRIQQ